MMQMPSALSLVRYGEYIMDLTAFTAAPPLLGFCVKPSHPGTFSFYVSP